MLPMEHPGRASSSQEFKVMGSFRVYFFDVSLGAAGRGWRGELGNRGWPSDHYSAVAVTGSAADVSVVRAAEIGGT
jgi:hypothetical protein